MAELVVVSFKLKFPKFQQLKNEVAREVPIRVGSPEGGLHVGGSPKGIPDQWRTNTHGTSMDI